MSINFGNVDRRLSVFHRQENDIDDVRAIVTPTRHFKHQLHIKTSRTYAHFTENWGDFAAAHSPIESSDFPRFDLQPGSGLDCERT